MALLRKWLGGEAGRLEAAPAAPSRSRFLERLLAPPRSPAEDERKQEVLLLGPPRGHQIEYFSHRGCRVSVEDIAGFLAAAREAEQAEDSEAPRLRLEQPEGRFDAALLFDLADRLEDSAVRALLEEVARILRPGGLAMLVSQSRASGAPEPERQMVFVDRGFRMDETGGTPRRRRVRPNRDLMRLLESFSVQQVQLRSDGFREVILRRPAG